MVRVQCGPPGPPNPSLMPTAAAQGRPQGASRINVEGHAAVVPEPVSLLSDEQEAASFVVLDREEEEEKGSAVHNQHQSLSLDYSLLSSSVDSEETLTRLRAVLDENRQLKETLQQNNLALQRQLKILTQWKYSILRRNEEHSHQLTKISDELVELKKENKELKGSKDGSTKEKEKKKDKKKDEKEKIKDKSSPVAAVDDKSKVEEKALKKGEAQVEKNETEEMVLEELKQKIEGLELAASKAADDLSLGSAQREILERDIAALKGDNDLLKSNNEAMVKEKWETAAANAELKKRLQQSMAMSYMQGGNDAMLQEELRKMQVALGEERKVTEKLSRSLELEKRRAESLEQKAKSSVNRKSGGSTGNQNLPDDMRLRDELLQSSMEKYRLQCENLGSSLEECEEKLASFEIQEEYHVEDLRKELSTVKRLLTEERKRSGMESQKLEEVQSLFGKVYKDYNSSIEALKQAHQRKMMESQQQNVYEEIRESSHLAQLDVLTANLVQAEEQIREERVKAKVLEDKLRQMELDVEAIPILKAQVEVYQADFNAERAAREKIAGEKADLEEQVRKIQQRQYQLNNDLGVLQGGQGRGDPVPIGLSSVRNRVSHMDEMVGRTNSSNDNAQQQEAYTCPSCNANFTQLEPLQVHVNRCLDRTF